MCKNDKLGESLAILAVVLSLFILCGSSSSPSTQGGNHGQ